MAVLAERLQIALEVEGVADADDAHAQAGERERDALLVLVGVGEAHAAAVDEGDGAAANDLAQVAADNAIRGARDYRADCTALGPASTAGASGTSS